MASTYSTTLRIELIGAGDQDGTWGDTTNSNLGTIIETAITGVQSITFSDANYTLTANNGLPDEARNAVLLLNGANTTQRNLIAPAVEKTYVVKNETGANVSITTNGAGANVVVQNGETKQVFCDGTNFYLSSVVVSTGTGNPVLSNSPTISSPTLTGTPVAPTASVSTDNTQIATTAFVRDIIPAGLISRWSGSTASIPSGWFLCDGANGTPDLRNRFIVGAGSTYAVAATGGSADAIVVAHTHTGTTNASGVHQHEIINTSDFGSSNGYFPFGEQGNPATATGTNLTLEAGSHTHTFTTASLSNAFITFRASSVFKRSITAAISCGYICPNWLCKSAKLPSSALGRSITETVVHDAGLRSLEGLSRAIAGLEIFLVGTGATPPETPPARSPHLHRRAIFRHPLRQPLDVCQLTNHAHARSFDVQRSYHRPALDLPASAGVRRRIINELPAGSSTTAIRHARMSSVAPRRAPAKPQLK
jgi:hypothetical protein